MAKIVNSLRTLRNHWKKTTFGVIVVSYGIKYGRDYYDTNELLKAYCKEAQLYGETPLPVGTLPRHVTVILNPAANDKKAKTQFEKYCAPLLYLSGMKISVVKTESVGEARNLMEVMSNTDAVVVAGGDGFISEVVTGMLRRNDSLSQQLPIGIIPLGKVNSVAQALFKNYTEDRIKLMAEATMAVVRNWRRPVDVMKIEILEQDQDSAMRKPIYALGQLKWGAFRDVEDQLGKYWLWGFLKPYAAYLFSVFKELTWQCNFQLRYTPPCEGCQRCRSYREKTVANQVYGNRWWHAFIPKTKSKSTEVAKDYSQIVNEQCGVLHERQVSAVELHAVTENNLAFIKPNKVKCLQVSIGPENISTWQFIREGWLRTSGRSKMNMDVAYVQQMDIVPIVPVVDVPEENAVDYQRWYSIDNDNYEVKPIKITLLPEMITVFCSPENI